MPQKLSRSLWYIVLLMLISNLIISTVNQNLAFSCYLRMAWVDPRLQYPEKFGTQRPNVEQFKDHRIWMPDVFVANARHSELQSSFHEDRGIKLQPNGSVLLSQRYIPHTYRPKAHLRRIHLNLQSSYEVEL